MDALLALVLLFGIIGSLGVYYTVIPELEYRDKHTEAEDVMTYLATYSAADVDELEEYTNDTQETILELIGSYWTSGNVSVAEDIAKIALENETDDCWELEFSSDTVGVSCEPDESVTIASRVASGYEPDEAPEGYVARGSLVDAESLVEDEYAYFGGYVGDGNITKNISLDNKDSIQNVTMELDTSGNFTLYINDQFSGNYSPETGELRADEWNVDEQYWDNLEEGENELRFNFTSDNASISGGYFHVSYNLTEFHFDESYESVERKQLPGIDGVINLYSAFYAPGKIQNISANLDFRSTYNISLILGNVTVYEGYSETGERKEVQVTDEEIKDSFDESDLNYSDISGRTVPLRLGMSDVTELEGRPADVFSVVDISGSMSACDVPVTEEDDYECANNCENEDLTCCWFSGYDCGTEEGCEACDGTWVDYGKERLTFAKQSTYDFIDIVLNASESRVGLNAYESSVPEEYTHGLSRDTESLYDTVDDWEAGGGTCICCGVNDAVERLDEQSNESRYRSMVMMSDGIANVECSEQGTGDPAQDAIESACEAYEEHGIEVYTIGFGPKEQIDEETMQEMADCAEGEYYYSELGELDEIYENVSRDMLQARYIEQELELDESDDDNITLYHDSYIEFNHTESDNELEYGEIPLTFESDRFGGEVESPKEGNFWIGEAARPLEARVTSYSSRYWSSKLNISNEEVNENIYNLSKYGEEFEEFGDPYPIRIPTEYITQENNTLFIDTSSSEGNFTGGSPDSRVLYTVAVNASVGYGDTFPKYEGGNHTVELSTGETYELGLGNVSDPWDPDQDALDDMVQRLFDKLDVNDDGRVDIRISPENIHFEEIEVGEVPYLWGPGVFTLKLW